MCETQPLSRLKSGLRLESVGRARPKRPGQSSVCFGGARETGERPWEKLLGKGGYKGGEAKAAAVMSSAKNIPHESRDLTGLCACMHVFAGCVYISVSLSLCVSSSLHLLQYSPPASFLVPHRHAEVSFLCSISRHFKHHCPLLLTF